MANYIKSTAIQENSISETKLDSSLQSWKETVTNHINNNDNPHNITKSSIGLDNVTNDAQVKRSELGVANGVATLDSTGKVPSGQLPSYVDDVIEGYLYNGVFYKDTSYTTSIVGESGKIYIDLPTNKTYRWTGSVYGVISETIALGETSSTAYRGDRGKIAYDHSQSAHAPSNAQANVIETIKVNGTALTPNSKAVDITIPTIGNGTITIKQGGTSKGTFTTNQNGNTTIELTDTNTTYTAGDGLSLSGTTFSNNGVRSIATGTTNGTISVNTNGNISNIEVYGLKSAAYTNSSDYAAASHTHSYLPLSGGTMANTNVVTNLNADLLDGYHATMGSNQPWGTIPAITPKGWMDVGRQFEFHYDNTYSSDYSTMLRCTGNYDNIVDLPSASGTLALLTDNVASATNADTIDGYHADSFTKKLYLGTTDLNSIDDSLLGQQSGNANATTELHYPVEEAGGLISILSTYNSTNQIYGTYRTNRWFARGAGTGLSSRTSWREFAFLDSNVASASKWETPRTITLTGSVTGSVSIDGSANVSLATTTNHTHTFDSLISKPTTISGYGITDALTNKYISYKADFQHYVILLCQIGANSTKTYHTINGIFLTSIDGSTRYQAAYINVHCSDWTSGHNEYYGFTPFGLGTKCRLVTCTYQSGQYLAITFENTQATSIYFDGSYSNILFTPILYYTSDTSTVENSEIYNSITEVTYNKIPLISSAETALTSSNYNTYAPKLDGTGATGTWGISISGNAATATNLTSTTVIPFNSTSSKYRKFASINITNRYEGKQALLLLNTSLTAASRGNSCKVYVMAYQQNTLGNPPYYSIETDCDNRNFEVYAVLNYTSTTSTIELYAYGKGLNYHSLTISLLSGANIIDIGSDILSSLPSGTVITPTKYGSVYSATKLATSRTIWGQSFDGTGNVSGALTGVTSITASGHAKVNSLKANNICIECDNNGNSAGRGDEINNYDGSLYLQHNTSNNCFICTGGGNVGIGTNTPSYKLHVVGDGYFTENVITESDFSSRGNAIIDGYVGIGTQNPAYQLDVKGDIRVANGNISLNVRNTQDTYFISADAYNGLLAITSSSRPSNPAFLMSNQGYVNLNCDSPGFPAYPLVVNGTISCTKLLQTSDIKYKTNIKQIEYEEALKIIENLNPVTWDWNENTVETGSSSGFVAQEAEEFIPNAISKDNENNLSLDYTQLHSYEIKVIQEQQKEIKDLKQRLEVLENLVLQLTNREI